MASVEAAPDIGQAYSNVLIGAPSGIKRDDIQGFVLVGSGIRKDDVHGLLNALLSVVSVGINKDLLQRSSGLVGDVIDPAIVICYFALSIKRVFLPELGVLSIIAELLPGASLGLESSISDCCSDTKVDVSLKESWVKPEYAISL